MAAARREKNPGAHVLANYLIVAVRITGAIALEREGEGPDEFLRHAAGEIGNFVMPVIAIEAPIGGAVRVAVLQREKLRDFAQCKLGEQFTAGRVHRPWRSWMEGQPMMRRAAIFHTAVELSSLRWDGDRGATTGPRNAPTLSSQRLWRPKEVV